MHAVYSTISVRQFFLPLLLATVALFIRVSAEGGMAEMKALTGDAPYLGYGNRDAPEYFGSAVYRQYYKEAGAPPGVGYRGRYAQNAINSYGGAMVPPYPGAGYRLSYRGYGRPVENYGEYGNYGQPAPVFGRGGYYTGRGNDWA